MAMAFTCQSMTHFLSITPHFFHFLQHVLSSSLNWHLTASDITWPQGTRYTHRTSSSLINNTTRHLFSWWDKKKITVRALILIHYALTVTILQRENSLSRDHTGAFLWETVGVWGQKCDDHQFCCRSVIHQAPFPACSSLFLSFIQDT